jgi:hypothetical protein
VKRIFIAVSFFTIFHVAGELKAQNENLSKTATTITYEDLYDTPYDINKLFIHLQPMYGELFTTNTTIGLGVKAQYYLKNIADFEGHIRAPYARSFDLTRDAAYKNSTVDNSTCKSWS